VLDLRHGAPVGQKFDLGLDHGFPATYMPRGSRRIGSIPRNDLVVVRFRKDGGCGNRPCARAYRRSRFRDLRSPADLVRMPPGTGRSWIPKRLGFAGGAGIGQELKMKHVFASIICAAGLTISAAALPAMADSTAPKHLRGEVETTGNQTFAMKPINGAEVPVIWDSQTKFGSLTAAKLSDIKQGMFVGTAAVPQPDGTQKAVEVHIFPESMRGTGEGFRPFPQVPKGTMTNATVTNMIGSTGTNEDGRTLTLTYKDGRQTVVVPKWAPIVLLAPGDASMLKPHAKVSVTGNTDPSGKFVATRILIGVDGTMPPI
jgi:hypothetical protein